MVFEVNYKRCFYSVSESILGTTIIKASGNAGETLRGRGAQVDCADLYRRVRPVTGPGELSRLLDAGIDILTIASGETLDNLLALAAEEQRDITSLPLVVLSERLLMLARERGFTDTVIIAKETSDSGMVEAIRQWREMVTTE